METAEPLMATRAERDSLRSDAGLMGSQREQFFRIPRIGQNGFSHRKSHLVRKMASQSPGLPKPSLKLTRDRR